MNPKSVKLTFIEGLKEVVLHEIAFYPSLQIIETKEDSVYLSAEVDFFIILKLKSIINAYVVRNGDQLNPAYISKHKSILGEMIEEVFNLNTQKFRTYKLSCAGDNSLEVKEIKKYIEDTFKLNENEEADLELYIGKNTIWEIGVRLTARPLSLRDYKVENIKGGMNPVIAYAMNSLIDLRNAKNYLNVCSGSGTLLIEVGLQNPDLSLVGFDIDGATNALAVKNIKKAGLIKSIKLARADVKDLPDFGMFDVITSDLPFGMQIGKGEDLDVLYKAFILYCERFLNKNGVMVVYTTENKLLQSLLAQSEFEIIKTLSLKLPTSVESYIYPKIFICKFKSK